MSERTKKASRPTRKPNLPAGLLDAIRYFADQDRALAFMAAIRWPDGTVTCPTCGSKEVSFLSSRRLWKCKTKHARQQFSIKVGTVMEDSPIGLDKWLPAMWMLANCKNGVSSYELARGLRVTQTTAWFMLHRLRLAMQESGGKLGGFGKPPVEIDETGIGGAARMMNARQRKSAAKASPVRFGMQSNGRAVVLGMLERGGRVRATVVPNTKGNYILESLDNGTGVIYYASWR